MNHNEEVPDNLGGLDDMQPADVLKKVKELLWAQKDQAPLRLEMKKDQEKRKLEEDSIEGGLMESQEKKLRIIYQPMTINVFITEDFSGEIRGFHVAHADVAVGVAEKGSNVYHHKTEKHE